jgi:hypothetical protein
LRQTVIYGLASLLSVFLSSHCRSLVQNTKQDTSRRNPLHCWGLFISALLDAFFSTAVEKTRSLAPHFAVPSPTISPTYAQPFKSLYYACEMQFWRSANHLRGHQTFDNTDCLGPGPVAAETCSVGWVGSPWPTRPPTSSGRVHQLTPQRPQRPQRTQARHLLAGLFGTRWPLWKTKCPKMQSPS